MKIGVNQFSFPMSYDVVDAIHAAARLGFDSIELCLTATNISKTGGGVTDALDISGYVNRLLNVDSHFPDFAQLKQIASDSGIRVSSIGGIVSFSIYPLTSCDSSIATQSMDAIRKMQEAASVLGANTVLVIPGMLDADMGYQEGYTLAQERISRLAGEASEIQLGIENVWNNMLYSPLELCRFVDEMQRDNVGIYFDIAHARRLVIRTVDPDAWFAHPAIPLQGLSQGK